VRRLIAQQNSAGAWDETAFTGNGFPNHFYMRYYLYPHYFPLLALANFRARLQQLEEDQIPTASLKNGELMRMRRPSVAR
jgi:hypothetical protein